MYHKSLKLTIWTKASLIQTRFLSSDSERHESHNLQKRPPFSRVFLSPWDTLITKSVNPASSISFKSVPPFFFLTVVTSLVQAMQTSAVTLNQTPVSAPSNPLS